MRGHLREAARSSAPTVRHRRLTSGDRRRHPLAPVRLRPMTASPSSLECYPLLARRDLRLPGHRLRQGRVVQRTLSAFLETCRRLHLPAALERSRSGRGGHVWLFFDGAIPAALARRLGSTLLTETMEDRPDVGLDSYDRLFPNQDTLPQGGFGNLIALPLQKRAARAGQQRVPR
ncbi:MAG: hypothetical protein MZW92_78000 [Comamonadaceae bacterium]|nr:hypothetical protein [Comamonadaceae bacterium]